MILGELDPLKDEAMFFASRLVEVGCDIKIHEMEMMPHGFFNFYFPNGGDFIGLGMPEANIVIEKSIVLLNQMI